MALLKSQELQISTDEGVANKSDGVDKEMPYDEWPNMLWAPFEIEPGKEEAHNYIADPAENPW